MLMKFCLQSKVCQCANANFPCLILKEFLCVCHNCGTTIKLESIFDSLFLKFLCREIEKKERFFENKIDKIVHHLKFEKDPSEIHGDKMQLLIPKVL